MGRLRKLTLIAVLLAVIVFCIKNRKPSTIVPAMGLLVNKSWLVTNPQPLTPVADVRPSDQTFLTYPEWFLVFSPAEQADYFKTHTSTTFPYLKHVDQLWRGYYVMYEQIKGNYPFNAGYHLMIWVIAGSTTVEYSCKSFYETIIGRVTDTSPGDLCDEDKLNATYLQDYTAFINDLPWYQYDFNKQLKQLWTNTPIFGQHPLRKLERRYYLTTELMVKSGYGWLIGLGTKSAYGTASLKTAVVFSMPAVTKPLASEFDKKKLNDSLWLIDLPRYNRFNPAATALAENNVVFKEIAGNISAIMLTVLTRRPLNQNPNYAILFSQPVITKPGLNRIALATPVADLSTVLAMLRDRHIQVEHIYDY
ncbi:MAG: hypothetical protein ACTHNW_22270 [Mucilaginibacter sp.]